MTAGLTAPIESLWPALGRTSLQTRCLNALWHDGVRTVGQLAGRDALSLLDARGLGAACLVEVVRALGEHGLSLSDGEQSL